jgi:hypothetical protein
MRAAPRKMNPVRAMSENTTPNSRTFCWSSRGTRKLVMMMYSCDHEEPDVLGVEVRHHRFRYDWRGRTVRTRTM